MLQELKRWREGFVEKYGESEMEEWDAGDADLTVLRSSLLSVPLFSEKRLIIVKNLLQNPKRDGLEPLLDSLEKLPDTTVAVFAELDGPDKRTTAFKRLSGLGTTKLFLKPKDAQLESWAMRRAEQYGAHLDLAGARYLISLVGDDGFTLDHEINKLSLFTEGGAIHVSHIEELIQNQVQKSVFALTDALAKKDTTLALRILRDLQEGGEDAGFLFSMMARQFRLLLEMKSLSEKGHNPTMIARDMAVHPFVVSSTLRYTKNFTHEKLHQILRHFLTIDRRVKSGLLPLKPREEDHFFLAIERIFL